VDRDGSPLCEGLSLETDGDRVVVSGSGAQALAAAFTLTGDIVRGQVLVDGLDLAKAEHVGRVGIAPLDPPLPPRMTVEGYLDLGFRTAGFPARAASTATASALTDLGIPNLANRRTESLSIVEMRALALASAMLPGSRTVIAQTPLLGLEGPQAHLILSVLGYISKHRRVLATSSRFDGASAERDLIMGATHVAIVGREALLWSGTPAQLVAAAPLTSLWVRGDSAEFLHALAAAGFTVHGLPPRFAVSAPEASSPADLLAIAHRTNTTILEMVPLLEPQPPPLAAPPQEPEP
jgi:ABC-type multidrug transport system ATPase subunit